MEYLGCLFEIERAHVIRRNNRVDFRGVQQVHTLHLDLLGRNRMIRRREKSRHDDERSKAENENERNGMLPPLSCLV